MNKSSKTITHKQKKVAVFFAILFMLALIGMIWTYLEYRQSQKKIKNLQSFKVKQNSNQQEKKRILDEVSKLMILPNGEASLLTISNPEKLAEQKDFFKKSQQGDKLLVYSKKAILYRPEKKKIVDVAPVVNRNNDQTNRQQTKQSQQSVTIEIRNGSSKNGVASSLSEQLKQRNSVEISNVTTTDDYENTVIVNRSNKNVTNLKNSLNAEILSSMPEDEPESPADIIVILGQDTNL
jgi:hypothetical protein